MLLVDLSGYSTQAGPGQLSLTSVAAPLYLAVALIAAGVAFARARTRYDWLLGAVSMIAALPRFLPYEASFLLVGFGRREPPSKPS